MYQAQIGYPPCCSCSAGREAAFIASRARMKCNRCAFRHGKPGDIFPAIGPSVSGDVRMKRYFFHQRIGEELIEDFEGFEYDSAVAARTSTVISARHLWAAAILAGDDLSRGDRDCRRGWQPDRD